MNISTTLPPYPRSNTKSYYQRILDEWYSVPLKKAGVPTDAELSPEVLLSTYMTHGKGAEGDELWYFRPWLSTDPKESGVYLRRQYNGYLGYAFFDATAKRWLMSHATVESAVAAANRYKDEISGLTRELSYHSNHQNVLWSAVDVNTIADIEFKFGSLELDPDPNSSTVCLAMIRFVLDPTRERRYFGYSCR